MDFEYSPKVKALQKSVQAFMESHVYPNQKRYKDEVAAGDRWQPVGIDRGAQEEGARRGAVEPVPAGIRSAAPASPTWNTPRCARSWGAWPGRPKSSTARPPTPATWRPSSATAREAQKKEWLEPLLEGKIRSCFAMTEPRVASSDATNIESRIERRGDSYIINGRKWWSSGAPDPRCKLFIFMGKTDPSNPNRHQQQSMILVPRDAKGVKIVRWLPVFGFDDAPHGHAEVEFENVEVPVSNMLLGEGRGFEIAQGRLGPGRIHHTMRAIGQAEMALEKMCKRVQSRVAFGKPIAEQTVTLERIAESRIVIDQARLLVLKAADMMDKVGNKAAAAEIAMIKVAAPNMLCQVIDWAIQAHGGAGVTEDFGLAEMYAHARSMRIFDGPDEVHRNQIARLELRKHRYGISTKQFWARIFPADAKFRDDMVTPETPPAPAYR